MKPAYRARLTKFTDKIHDFLQKFPNVTIKFPYGCLFRIKFSNQNVLSRLKNQLEMTSTILRTDPILFWKPGLCTRSSPSSGSLDSRQLIFQLLVRLLRRHY